MKVKIYLALWFDKKGLVLRCKLASLESLATLASNYYRVAKVARVAKKLFKLKYRKSGCLKVEAYSINSSFSIATV